LNVFIKSLDSIQTAKTLDGGILVTSVPQIFYAPYMHCVFTVKEKAKKEQVNTTWQMKNKHKNSP